LDEKNIEVINSRNMLKSAMHKLPKISSVMKAFKYFQIGNSSNNYSTLSHIYVIGMVITILMMMKSMNHHNDSSTISSCSDSSTLSSSCSGTSCSSDTLSTCSSSTNSSIVFHEQNHHEESCHNCESPEIRCTEPYDDLCAKSVVCSRYGDCEKDCYLEITVKHQQLCIPQYMLRNVPYCLDFYYNFVVVGITSEIINSFIMLKDLLQWMTSGVGISSDILPDGLYPVIFIYKDNCGKVHCGEYLKIFVSTDDVDERTAFVSKGADYLCVYEPVRSLLVGCNDCPLIYDLLNGNEFYSYFISGSNSLSLLQFLIAFLSLYLIPECLLGSNIVYDTKFCYDTKMQLEYFFKYFNCDCNVSTVIT